MPRYILQRSSRSALKNPCHLSNRSNVGTETPKAFAALIMTSRPANFPVRSQYAQVDWGTPVISES